MISTYINLYQHTIKDIMWERSRARNRKTLLLFLYVTTLTVYYTHDMNKKIKKWTKKIRKIQKIPKKKKTGSEKTRQKKFYSKNKVYKNILPMCRILQIIFHPCYACYKNQKNTRNKHSVSYNQKKQRIKSQKITFKPKQHI